MKVIWETQMGEICERTPPFRFKMLIFRGVEIETMDLGVRIWRMKQHMAQLHYQILRDSFLKKPGR